MVSALRVLSTAKDGPRGQLWAVPFRITRRDAVNRVMQQERTRLAAPLAFESGEDAAGDGALTPWQGSSLRAVFLPLRVAALVCSSDYVGSVGYHRTVTSVDSKGNTQRRTVTDWWPASGSLRRMAFNGRFPSSAADSAAQVYADFRYPEPLLAALKGRTVQDAEKFSSALFEPVLDASEEGSGSFGDGDDEEPEIDPFRVTPIGARDEIVERVQRELLDIAKADLKFHYPRADEYSVDRLDGFRLHSYEGDSVYVAAYVLRRPSLTGIELEVFVNGSDGRVSGETVLSPTKGLLAGAFAGLLGRMAFARIVLGLPFLANPLMLFLSSIGVAAVGAGLAAYYPQFRHARLDAKRQKRWKHHENLHGIEQGSWEESEVNGLPHNSTADNGATKTSGGRAGGGNGTPGAHDARITDLRAERHLAALGLELGATVGEAQVAFRKLAMKFHPDHNTQLPEEEQRECQRKFREVMTAFNGIRRLPRKKAS